MRELWILYRAFFRIGIMTFGGGYAMLPMLEREVVEKHGWAREDELLNYFAVGQCTPGVIAVNTATFVGQKQKGVMGALSTTLGVITPSLLIILTIAMILQHIMDNPVVIYAFAGVRVAVCALIAASVTKLIKTSVKDVLGIGLCLLAFALVACFGQSPILVTLGAGLAGVVFDVARERRSAK